MNAKLAKLRDEVEAAQEKLRATQVRVDENIERVTQLRAEAVRGEGGDLTLDCDLTAI